MGESNKRFIGDFLKQVRREVILKDNVQYKLLGVMWYGKGMFLREEKYGKEIKAEKLYRVNKGDFVYNRLFAWKSSFAIVGEEHDGCLVSNEFPTFEYNREEVDPYYLLNYVLQPNYIDFVNRQSGGMSSVSRKRFKEEEFLRSTFPFLQINLQREKTDTIRRRKGDIDDLSTCFKYQSSHLSLLRQAILQEAIEGKLTAGWREKHSANSESSARDKKGSLAERTESAEKDEFNDAAVLLKKIKDEKQKLIVEGKIRKEKPLAPIKPEEVPFVLPEGWVWCRLGEVIELVSGQHIETNECNNKGKGFPYLTGPSDFGRINPIISRWTENPKVMAQKGDLLITVKGSGVGKTNICNIPEVVISRQLMAIRSPYINRGLVRQFIVSKKESLQNSKDGLIPGITRDHILDSLFPLPPLAEQKAIVERVDRLMAMVDELEAQVKERKELAEKLMQSVLREAFEG
ncbi:MAG: restriction endonuclease subunit S [Spirochaetes bacterium]|nr:restriction endonuclease subunit S [Spirochaetota bacterium]